jgi:hypothetical protein
MTQVCSQCATVNPPEASYCYFDGVLLSGHTEGTNTRLQLFPTLFVFPNGKVCRSFDQLAMCCQQYWAMAVDMLRQGFFSGFLGSIGRTDLAMAAQDASRFPDLERGLDQFLTRLPTQVLQPPRLEVAPKEVYLGQLQVGTDRRIEVHLANLGMRLLYGSVVSDANWLALGDPPGCPQKLFQCSDETSLVVNVRGQNLRAGIKTLEGRLLIESNGGASEIVIRADVPAFPFAEGVLVGATSPRQIAEKAKAAPKVAAVLFEDGTVARWFQRNGWTYPVHGPTASGLGAVQQFFEALGLTPPPKVEISTQSIRLAGMSGENLEHVLEITSEEKRPVYAHAITDQPWLEVGPTEYRGRVAILNVRVRSVPPRPGDTLVGKVTVRANGNQRFEVAVELTVAEPGWDYMTPRRMLHPEQVVEHLPPLPPPFVDLPPPSTLDGASLVAAASTASTADAVHVTVAPIKIAPAHSPSILPVAVPTLVPSITQRPQNSTIWMHLLPLGLLLLALVAVLYRDVLLASTIVVGEDGVPIDRRQLLHVGFEDGSGEVRGVQTMRFGLTIADGPSRKKLTFHEQGATNNTVLRINGQERVFGHAPGRWKQRTVPLESGQWGVRVGKRSEWVYDEQIEVAQIVEIVPGDAIEVSPGQYQRRLDTCLIRYQITNRGKTSQLVGLRILLDTMIGSNDGVPFVIPGDLTLCDTCKSFNDSDQVPDFLLALEHPSLQDPGTVAQLGLKLGPPIEPPSRVVLAHWPDRRLNGAERMQGWELPLVSMKQFHDSAVAIYWNEKPLLPGETREVGLTYGLGNVSTGKSGALGLTVSGELHAEGPFSVVALVNNPVRGQSLMLEAEEGLTLLPTSSKTQSVPFLSDGSPNRTSPVTWRLQAARPGRYQVTVHSSTGERQTRTFVIRARSIF